MRWAIFGAVALDPDATVTGAAYGAGDGRGAAVRSRSAATWAAVRAVPKRRTSSMAPSNHSPQRPLPPIDSGADANAGGHRRRAGGHQRAVDVELLVMPS